LKNSVNDLLEDIIGLAAQTKGLGFLLCTAMHSSMAVLARDHVELGGRVGREGDMETRMFNDTGDATKQVQELRNLSA
jgi:hypothetical protein